MRKWLLRWIRKFAGVFGATLISRDHYEALLLEQLNSNRHASSSKEGPAGTPERADALTSGDAHKIPPAVPFPMLPGVSADTLRIEIVDVGAQPLSYEQDIYAPLVQAGPCHIIGFDPFVDPNLDSLIEDNAPPDRVRQDFTRVTILPYFIGDGSKAKFHINAFSPTSSLFPSNLKLMTEFSGLAEICTTRSVIEVTTRKLDDVAEIESCDFLKIDVQGGDFDVIAHGSRILERTLFVHIEAEFAEIYTGQPLFSDIDVLLRRQHFEFVDFVKLGWNNYKAFPLPSLRSRLLWSDCIYMKNPEYMAARDPRLLLRAAYIAHVNYRKYDLAAHLICLYDSVVGSSLHNSYVSTTRRHMSHSLDPTQY
jgi:FkbM family methyltransferase